ncbi:MAG TPA: ABC transporter substrate-binding protein [Dehalococcoidia bacterium]|nr:ABC transporter substrate-binding protein [Dehalococcoidia bacterium]
MSSRRNRALAGRHRAGWPLLGVLVVGMMALGVTWFALAGPLTSSNDQAPSRYSEALVGAPGRVNPLFVHLNDVDRDMASLVFSGLTRLGPDGEVLPDLAQSWEVSEDGRTFTFRLRAGVAWQTGAPFTAADVLFTYGLLADANLQGAPEEASLWRQAKCSAPNDLMVQCTLPQPFAPFLAFATMGILPKHILEGAQAATLGENGFNKKPVGTGPFRLAQLDETHVILKANTQYYGSRPQLDEIEFRFYPDTATAAAALSRKDVEGLLLGPEASQEDFDAVSGRGDLKAYTANRSAYTVLYLNNAEAPLNDGSVRRAIAYAVDIDGIVGKLLAGRAVRGSSPIAPGTWAANAELEPYPHDQDEARSLLEAAGWLLPGEGKVRQRDGVELRISLMTDRDALRGALADEVAQELEEVGISVTVVRQDSTALVQDFLIPRQYQAAIFGWDVGADPDPYPAWHSSQISDNGRNLAAYANPEADAVMEEARRTTDLDRRQALYYTFQTIFHDDVPSVILYYPVYTYFVSDEVKDVKMGTLFNTSSRFASVASWRVGEAKRASQP